MKDLEDTIGKGNVLEKSKFVTISLDNVTRETK